MKERVISYLTVFFLLLLLPYGLTIAVNGMDAALLKHSPDMEACLPVILSVQISEQYDLETVKSQAVIARTNFYRRLMEKESVPEILGEIRESMKEGNTLWKLPKKVYEKASEQTEGQVLTFEHELKLVPYHEISSGQTRDGNEVFHDEAFTYLKSVDSSVDKNSPDYVSSTYIAQQQLPKELEVKKRDPSGYVTELMADENLLEGEAFRQGLGLASPNFTIQKIGNEIRFLCKGKGHGIGFSQYGGNAQAKAGAEYQDILAYYFPAMELEDINGIFAKK